MSELARLHRQQLATNIATIIEYLSRVPGVISVEIEDKPTSEETWEKKVFVKFAGCDEPIVLELY